MPIEQSVLKGAKYHPTWKSCDLLFTFLPNARQLHYNSPTISKEFFHSDITNNFCKTNITSANTSSLLSPTKPSNSICTHQNNTHSFI